MDTLTPAIFVATIAKILRVFESVEVEQERMKELFGRFGAAFVDEGHYEPAPKWSKAVRSLGCPTVLMTATPYRNDRKFFTVDDKNQFSYPHHEAVRTGYLREPAFELLSDQSPEGFVAELLQSVDKIKQQRPDSRTIVRCGDVRAIRATVAALEAADRTVVGLHHTFPTAGSLRSSVPDPKSTETEFWVHQNKLIEGLDDSRFRILALQSGPGTDRQVVQQIGRVLRNPGKSADDRTAWVFAASSGDAEEVWKRYEDFDRSSGDLTSSTAHLAERMQAAQPPSLYYGGRFRSTLDMTADDCWKQFAFPLATRVFHARTDLSLDVIADGVADEWQVDDRLLGTPQRPDPRTVILPYIAVGNSSHLLTGIFVEATFGFTVLRVKDGRLFFYDRVGRTPTFIADRLRHEERALLSKLLARDSRFTTVSLDNTDIGQQSVRSRTIRAVAIEEIAPELSDYAYICSVAEGYPPVTGGDDRFRRYLGVSRARVRDDRGAAGNFAAYALWLDGLSAAMDSEQDPSVTFGRYAEVVEPADKQPRHVLFDVTADDFERVDENGVVRPLVLDDYANAVLAGRTKIGVGGREMDSTVEWDNMQGRYVVGCQVLRDLSYLERSAPHRELVSVINSEQLLRVIPQTDGFMYVNGSFVRPLRPEQDLHRFRLLKLLEPVPALKKAKSEKGGWRSDDSWDRDSSFGLIDEIRPKSRSRVAEPLTRWFRNVELLFCGDMGKEIADFIAVQPGRVAFIHAKSGNGSKVSASALHEVVSQAVKNLLWLQPMTIDSPVKPYWDTRWKNSKDGEEHQAGRIRVGDHKSGEKAWEHTRSVIVDPAADREVWLVLGAALSKSELEAAVATPTPELIQIYALLQTAWGAASQIGARLRVFCSP
ncbi:DEAD/DEAH box helicase [Kribbella endophytica]